jgi:hypothetical protein
MQKTIIVIVCLIGLLSLQTTQAQGVLCISNLGLPVTGSGSIGSNSWVAQTFVTGNNAGGYLLSSVQLLMNVPLGTPSGFTVSIYSKTGDPHSESEPGDSPQVSIGSLTGSEPTMAGIFSYNTPGIVLSPSTFYFVVITAATSTNDGSYTWSATSGLTQSNRFTIDDEFFGSSDGSTWTWYPRQKTFQLGLYASAVPPPNLSIRSDGSGNIKVLWPNLGSYILEQSTNVFTTNWTASSYIITNNVFTNSCTVTPADENLFFRLKQQLP